MQWLLDGAVSGLGIAVLAAAFSIVYLPTRLFHVALGAVFVVAPHVVWLARELGLGAWLGVCVALVIGSLLSVGCEYLNHGPLERRGASPAAHLLSSLGIYIVLVQFLVLPPFGSRTKALRGDAGRLELGGGLVLAESQAVAAVVLLVVLAVLALVLLRTRFGLLFKALADDSNELALRGFNVSGVRLAAFGASGFLASLAGLLAAYDLAFDSSQGLPALLLAVVATIVGGRTSMIGPILGGLALGVLRSAVTVWLGASWQEAVTYLLLIAFLLVRPFGLIGSRSRLEVEQ